MELSNAIRIKIKKLCNEKHLTIKQLAYLSHIPYSTLSSFMCQKTRTLSLKTLYKVCFYLNVELVDFFSDSVFVDTIDEQDD